MKPKANETTSGERETALAKIDERYARENSYDLECAINDAYEAGVAAERERVARLLSEALETVRDKGAREMKHQFDGVIYGLTMLKWEMDAQLSPKEDESQ